jgi:regulator of replication initiation timing
MSEPTSTTPESTAPRRSNKSTIAIVVLSVIIILQGLKIYFDSQEKQAVEAKLTSTEQEFNATRDRLKEINAELDEKIAEVTKLGGDVADLEKAKTEVEAELRRRNRATGKEIKALKDKVEGYELLLKNKDEEIEKLKSVNKALLSENTTLKTEKNQLGDSISQISKTSDALAEKVAIASQLKAENIKIVALNDRGKERESPFKSRQVGKLKIDFNIAANEVAPIEGKKIIVRIIDENGQVIFDMDRGSGTFIYNSKEEFYTASQEILFDNTQQKMSYLYDKGSDYAAGTYQLEIYAQDSKDAAVETYKMGSGQFVVK